MTRFLSDIVIKAVFLRKMWREMFIADRWAYGVILAQILFGIYLIWSLA